MDSPTRRSKTSVAGWVVLGVSLLAAALFEEWIRLHAQNHPWRVGIIGGIALLVTGIVLLFAGRGILMVAAVFVFGGWLIGLISGLDDRDHELGDYCRYGARSQAEIDSCMKRINTDEIAELDTPAARFSRGETNRCGRGSGPHCAEAARSR